MPSRGSAPSAATRTPCARAVTDVRGATRRREPACGPRSSRRSGVARRAPADARGLLSMLMEVPRLGADSSIDDVETALRDAGCVVVEHVVADDVMDGIAGELEPYLRATAVGAD